MSAAVEKPVDSYLSQLVDQCEAHGRQHRTGAQQPKKETCISILNKIRNMLPRLCNSFFRSVAVVGAGRLSSSHLPVM